MAISRFVVGTTVSIPWPSTWSEVINGPGGGAVTTPAVPASATAIENPNAFPVTVVITGGTMTAVTVNGVNVGAGAGTYEVPAAGTISMTYTVAPTWAWSATPGGPSAGIGESALVSAAAPPGGQAGPIASTIFIQGTTIYADSSAGNSASQQLYQALTGAGANMRAYVDGQDNVGHAALGN